MLNTMTTVAALAPPAAAARLHERWRVGWEIARFGVVGGGSTVIQLALYAFLAADLGSQLANIVSWLAATLLATEGHRRFTFAAGRATTEGDHVIGLATSLAALALSSLTLAALGNPSAIVGVVALVAVNAAVGLLRFVALRRWMLRPAR